MKKPSREDRTGSETEPKWISLIILWVLLISSVFPQVPINGFCQLKFFPAFPGFNRVTVADINFDSINDIILYSSSQKIIAIIEGSADSSFTDYKIINAPYQFSSITPVYNRKTGSEQFFFCARKKRVAGLFEFTGFRRFNMVAKIGFDSYPENVSAADIDNDGRLEYLVSGSGFNGLSIISFRKGELTEAKVEVNSSYGEAIFSDISNDGYPDIVAYNLLSTSMDVYYNDGFGGFEKVRSFVSKRNVDNLKSIDLNRDFFNDIIYTTENSINIIFGDFQSSYKSSLVIHTKNIPHKYFVADFNEDRFLDFAYIDTTMGLLSIIFGKGNNEYYPEVFYLSDKGLSGINLYDRGNIKNLVLLNKRGKINIISRMSVLPDEANIIPAIQPQTIASFDYGNNAIADVCYIDGYAHSMIFFVNDSKGIPKTYYSSAISEEHTNVVVDETDPFKKGFYCYSTGSKMLEIIRFDFKNNSQESDQLYLPGAIKDIKINQSKNIVHIYVAYEKNKSLAVGEYEYRDFKYNFKEYPPIDSDLIAPRLSLNQSPNVYYWKIDADTAWFFRAGIVANTINHEPLGNFSVKSKPVEKISQYLLDKKGQKSFNLVNSKNNFFSVVSNGLIFNISNLIVKRSKFNVGKEDIFMLENIDGNSFNGMLYLAEDHSFNRIEVKDEGKKLFFAKLFDTEEVGYFIIQKFVNDKNYLIYTQPSKGLLSYYSLK